MRVLMRSLLGVVAVTVALLVLGSSVAYAEEALVGYWKFDEPVAGDPVVDSSGNGGTGTPVGDPTPSTDVPSQIAFPDPYSLSFNGSDQYVAVPDPANHRYTLTSGTFSTWVKFNGWTGGWQDFVAKRTTGGGNVEYQWGYGTNSSGGNGEFKVTFASDGAEGGNSCCTDVDYSGTQLQLGVWYFVAMSFDGSSHTLKWYVDGTLEQTDDVASNLGFGSNTGADLDIGSSYDGTGEFMDGELDDTRIYNYVLSDAQIAEMADGQSGPNVNSSGALTDPEPVASVDCVPAGWTAGSQSCTIDASEENVVAGDPDPPSVSSVWWSTDSGQTWSQANGNSQTVALPAGTAITGLQAYAVDSEGTQGSTVAATTYQDDTPPTVAMSTPSGSLVGEQQLSGTVSLPALTQTTDPPAVGIGAATIQYSPAGEGQWHTACTISAPVVGSDSCDWGTTQVANGSYDLRELATDTLGNSATSPVVQSVTVDNPPPTASIACSPSTAVASWTNAVRCTVSGTAAAGATVTGLSYADNGGGATEASGATASFTPAVAGVNRLTATVTDSGGQTGTATAVVLYDATPPTPTLSPLAASLVGNVQLSGTAVLPTLGGTLPSGDSWPSIASVVMQYSPTDQNQWQAACTVANVTVDGDACNWETSAVPPGSYDIREVATDTVGNTAASAPQTVAVNETPIVHGTVTADALSAAGHRGDVFTLSAAGSKPAAGTTIRTYSWTLDGREIGHAKTLTWAAPRAGRIYHIVLAVTASTGATSQLTFTLETVLRISHTTVHFAYDSPKLSANDAETLKRLAAGVRATLHRHRYATATITSAGYASASIFPFGVHNPANEQRLSRERAQGVRNYLARALRSTATKFLTAWYAGNDPIATNFTLAGQAENRRVTITISIALNTVRADAG